jgi:hypothetical protein
VLLVTSRTNETANNSTGIMSIINMHRHHMSVSCIATLAWTVCAQVLSAQNGTDYLREHFRNLESVEHGQASYWLEIIGSSSGATARLIRDGSAVSTLAMPFHYNGGLALAHNGLVVAGGLRVSSTRVGVLAHLEVFNGPSGSPQLRLLGSTDYAAFDPVVMKWSVDMQGLFIVDGASDRLLYAPYQSGVFAPALGSCETVATAQQIPALGDPCVGMTILLDDPEDVSGVSVCIDSVRNAELSWTAMRSTAGWTLSSAVPGNAGLALSRPVSVTQADPGSYFHSSDLPAGPVDLVDPFGVSLATFQSVSGTWMALPSRAEFAAYPGLGFRLRYSNSGLALNILPIHSVGTPVSVPLLTVGKGRTWPLARIGDEDFGNGVPCTCTATAPLVFGASVAFRGSAGDPIDSLGFLEAQAFISGQADPSIMGESVGVNLPLPRDESLVGSVLLTQYLFLLPNGTVGRSDVFGTTISGDAAYIAMAGSASTSTASPAARQAARQSALSEWERGRGDRSVLDRIRAAWPRR